MIDDIKLKQLEDLVNGVDLTVIPYAKGNSIRIKNFVIRKSKHGYLLYDCLEHKKIDSYYSKTGAVAAANCYIKNIKEQLQVKELDDKLSKHHVDSMFYRNTIQKSKDQAKVFTAELRLDIAVAKTQDYKARLMEYIL